MRRAFLIVAAMLVCLTSANLTAAEKDAPNCKDHPLVPRLQGYYIVGCNSADAAADFDIPKGKESETIHIEGPSTAVLYDLQPDLKIKKPTYEGLKASFGDLIIKQGGRLAGTTLGQKWPVYKLTKDDKEYWIVLLVDPGEYFTGSYGVRIIEKAGKK